MLQIFQQELWCVSRYIIRKCEGLLRIWSCTLKDSSVKNTRWNCRGEAD